MEEDYHICDGCMYTENDAEVFPCNRCMHWVDGFLEATQYEPLK